MAAFLTLLGLLRWFQRRYSPHPELPRKLLHAGSGLLTLSFPFLFDRLWPVLLLTAGSATLIAAVKFIKPLRRPLGNVVDGVSRTTLGEIYFPISVAIVFALSLGRSALLFCVPILVLTLADATGALVGLRYGHTRFEGASKSVEGSVAFLVVAFFCIHIPLLLWSTIGRSETLLISLTMALLVMLLEGSAWRGLDNLFIPIGGFFLLQAYLPLGSDELLRRFVVTSILVLVVLVSRRSTTMLDDSLLVGAFLCYVTWALAGWRWIVPPAIGFLGFSLYSPDAPSDGRRFHTTGTMLSIWAAARCMARTRTVASTAGFAVSIHSCVCHARCHLQLESHRAQSTDASTPGAGGRGGPPQLDDADVAVPGDDSVDGPRGRARPMGRRGRGRRRRALRAW